MQIVTIAQFMQWVLSNFGVHNSNNEIIIITYGRIQCFTDIICKFIYQEFVRIEPQHISPFFVHKFVSKKRASVLDGRFLGFNSVKVILTLMESIIPPPLEFLSNLNGFAKHEIRNCSKGNVSSVFGNKRTSILFVIKDVNISNLLPIELIFNWPIKIRFGFSSLRFL